MSVGELHVKQLSFLSYTLGLFRFGPSAKSYTTGLMVPAARELSPSRVAGVYLS